MDFFYNHPVHLANVMAHRSWYITIATDVGYMFLSVVRLRLKYWETANE
jgi:hypothetical protein